MRSNLTPRSSYILLSMRSVGYNPVISSPGSLEDQGFSSAPWFSVQENVIRVVSFCVINLCWKGGKWWSSSGLKKCNYTGISIQGRSQTLNLGWAREEHFLILLLFSPIFFLTFFLNLALRVGGSPTCEGPGYSNVCIYLEHLLHYVAYSHQCKSLMTWK